MALPQGKSQWEYNMIEDVVVVAYSVAERAGMDGNQVVKNLETAGMILVHCVLMLLAWRLTSIERLNNWTHKRCTNAIFGGGGIIVFFVLLYILDFGVAKVRTTAVEAGLPQVVLPHEGVPASMFPDAPWGAFVTDDPPCINGSDTGCDPAGSGMHLFPGPFPQMFLRQKLSIFNQTKCLTASKVLQKLNWASPATKKLYSWARLYDLFVTQTSALVLIGYATCYGTKCLANAKPMSIPYRFGLWLVLCAFIGGVLGNILLLADHRAEQDTPGRLWIACIGTSWKFGGYLTGGGLYGVALLKLAGMRLFFSSQAQKKVD